MLDCAFEVWIRDAKLLNPFFFILKSQLFSNNKGLGDKDVFEDAFFFHCESGFWCISEQVNKK